MAEEQLKAVAFQPFNQFVDDNETVIELLQIQMRKKGIDMDELEAWKYLAWGLSSMCDVTAQMGGTNGYKHMQYVRSLVAPTCAANYKQHRTGILAPPTGPSFATPDEYYKQTDTVSIETTTAKFDGYL